MNKEEVRARIEEIGIIPAVRTAAAEEARFAAEAVASGGIPIVEITMTIPGALDVIAHLAKNTPDVLIGAGTILDTETARRCLDAGAHFLRIRASTCLLSSSPTNKIFWFLRAH